MKNTRIIRVRIVRVGNPIPKPLKTMQDIKSWGIDSVIVTMIQTFFLSFMSSSGSSGIFLPFFKAVQQILVYLTTRLLHFQGNLNAWVQVHFVVSFTNTAVMM